jgi:hypothetical protein
MSLKDITTKFQHLQTIETDNRLRIKISKTVNDEVYEIVTYVQTNRFGNAYSLRSVEFLSKERYESRFKDTIH